VEEGYGIGYPVARQCRIEGRMSDKGFGKVQI